MVKELPRKEQQVLDLVPSHHSCISGADADMPYIVWCDMWEMVDKNFGLRGCNYDVMESATRYERIIRCEYNYFCGRNYDTMKRGKPDFFEYEEWKRLAPVDMTNQKMIEFNDHIKQFKQSDNFKNQCLPYKNIWHKMVGRFGAFGALTRSFKKDSINYLDVRWLELDRWEPCYWPHIMLLDEITKNHPARSNGKIRFFVYW